MLGFPVDAVERRPAITGVVVGNIVAVEKHPNADRLQVAQVDVGGEKPLTIATAATNVAAGQVVAVATIGAQAAAADDRTAQDARRRIRGHDDLGRRAGAAGGVVRRRHHAARRRRPLGTDVIELFGLVDAVLDVDVTSNRVDAMSILGLARELAASFGKPLRVPPH